MSGVADTAKLLASLDLQDTMTPKLRSAIGGVSAAESKVGSLSSKVAAFASNLSGGASKALSHFTGQLGNLARYGAAAIGLGGFLSIGGIIEQSVSKLEDFSLSLEKVQTLTGETARDSGTLILLFEKFGISLDQVGTFAGFAEKTLGKLNEATVASAKAGKSAALVELERQKLERQSAGLSTKKIDGLIREQKATDALNVSLANAADGSSKLQAIDKQYGLALIDASGKTVSFSEELRQLADFYDRNHDAAQRAYVASTLLGRGYAALAPILNQGGDAIRAAAGEADALGLGSQGTADQIEKFRTQMRDLGVQANVLQLQIGMALIPTISHFATDISQFLTAHGSDITAFFRHAGDAAEHLAGTIGDLVGKASAFWGGLPGPLRDILTTGIAGDRIIKFAFGFSPIGQALKGIGNALISAVAAGTGKGLVAAGIGKLFVQPVFVTNPGFGGPKLPVDPTQTVEDDGLFATLKGLGFKAAVALAAVPLAMAAVADFIQTHAPDTKDFNHIGILDVLTDPFGKRDAYGYTPGDPRSPATSAAAAAGAPATANQREDRGILVATRDHGWAVADDSLKAALGRLSGVMDKADWLKKLQASWLKAGQTMHDKIKEALASLAAGKNTDAAAQFLGAKLGNAGFGAGGYDQALAAIAGLKNLQTKDPTVVKAIGELESRLPRLKLTKADLEAAEKIAQSSDPKNVKLDKLNAIEADLRSHGDRTTQRKVSDLIAAVKHQKFINNNTVNVAFPGMYLGGAGHTVTKRVSRSSTVYVG